MRLATLRFLVLLSLGNPAWAQTSLRQPSWLSGDPNSDIGHYLGVDAFPGRWLFDTATVVIDHESFTAVQAGVTGGTGSLTEGYFLFQTRVGYPIAPPALALLRHYHEAPAEAPADHFVVESCFRVDESRGLVGYLLIPDTTRYSAHFVADSAYSDNVANLHLSRKSGYYKYNRQHRRFELTLVPDRTLNIVCSGQ